MCWVQDIEGLHRILDSPGAVISTPSSHPSAFQCFDKYCYNLAAKTTTSSLPAAPQVPSKISCLVYILHISQGYRKLLGHMFRWLAASEFHPFPWALPFCWMWVGDFPQLPEAFHVPWLTTLVTVGQFLVLPICPCSSHSSASFSSTPPGALCFPPCWWHWATIEYLRQFP